MNSEQKLQMNEKLGFEKLGKLDYVCAWFIKASQFVSNSSEICFVSTNSITQGEQVDVLWSILIDKLKMNINFAYPSFKWDSDTRKKAKVTVVIIGMSKSPAKLKKLFEDGKILNPNYISPYLIGTNQKTPHVKKSSTPINGLTKLKDGAVPLDDGNYTFTTEEWMNFLKKNRMQKNGLYHLSMQKT